MRMEMVRWQGTFLVRNVANRKRDISSVYRPSTDSRSQLSRPINLHMRRSKLGEVAADLEIMEAVYTL